MITQNSLRGGNRLRTWCKIPHSTYTSSIFRCFEPSIGLQLLKDGFAVVDNAVEGHDTTTALRAEIDHLRSIPDALKANETHIVQPVKADAKQITITRFPKSNVRETELHRVSNVIRDSVPNLTRLENDSGLSAMLSVYIPRLTLTKQAVKAQHVGGHGGCFPVHVDSDPSVDARIVTAVLYLNKGWNADQDGGQLRVYPLSCLQSNRKHVDIEPVDGRMVLLSATETHHRVLPCWSPRYAITMWLFGHISKRATHQDRLEPRESTLGDIMASTRYRKVVTRIYLKKEWEESLQESHSEQEANALIQAHREEQQRLHAAVAHDIAARFDRFTENDIRRTLESNDELENALRLANVRTASTSFLK